MILIIDDLHKLNSVFHAQPLTQALFNREKIRLILVIYTDQFQIDQARNGAWGGSLRSPLIYN